MQSNIIKHKRKYECNIYVKDIIHNFMEEKMRSGEGYIKRTELFFNFENYYRKELKIKRINNHLFSLDYQELLKRMTKKYKAKYLRNGTPAKWIGVEIIYSDSDCESDIEL